MKIIKILSLLLACLLLAACGSQTPLETGAQTDTPETQPSTVDYQVKVVDANGQPYTAGVIVRILKGGEQVAMQVVDKNGSVTKTLEPGTYTAELMFTDSATEYVYDQTNLTLTPEAPQLEISLAYALGDLAMELYHKDAPVGAYSVDVCCTWIPLQAGQRNYFLFTPRQAGTYEVKVIGDVESLGWYGTPHYMSDTTMTEVENNCFTMSIRSDMIGSGEGGTSMLVLGIDPGTAESCILSIRRTGDPAWSPEDVPYEVYKTTVKLAPYTLPQGAGLLGFDLTAEGYDLVLGEDGFYHLNTADGPLVVVYLGKDTQYMSCFQTVLTKTGVRKYFYDENGKFLRREAYDECLREYFVYMDQDEGVYPLTEDLKYIIQQAGDHHGWFRLDANTSLFRDDDGMALPGINGDIAWLFMCAYIAQ